MKVFMCLSLMLVAMLGLSASKKVVCYFTNWSFYRPGIGKFIPSNIDANLCTHVMYAFAVVENNRLKIFDQWADVDLGHYKKVAEVRRANPSAKVLIAVGGWNAGSEQYSNMAKSASTRKIFIDSVVAFTERFGYDGIDLDWEYPAKRGGVPEDKENFSLLIKELQARFSQISRSTGKPKMLVTAAVSAAPHTASVAYDIPTICRELDFVNLMHYDIHGTWESKTGYSSPLYAGPQEVDPQNMPDTMTRAWLDAGCRKDKLIFGIPMYGRGWTISGSPGIGTAGTKGIKGPIVREAGVLSYSEICQKLSSGWTESFDDVAVQAIATGGDQWYTFDNERSVAIKTNYINSMNLGGAMIWALDFDDFNGQACGKGRYPLLSIISRGMRGGRPAVVRPAPRRNTGTGSNPRPATTTTTTTTTTEAPRAQPSSTSRQTSGCEPECNSNSLTYLADKCNPQVFYMCHAGTAYKMTCGNGTVFDSSCNCCVSDD